jgi:hypothetical protein
MSPIQAALKRAMDVLLSINNLGYLFAFFRFHRPCYQAGL